MRTRNNGFTILEILVTLSIMGIALGLLSTFSMPSQRSLLANDAKAMLQQARFESIKRNVAVAVVWDSTARSFKMLANTNNAMSCTATTVLQIKNAADYRNVSVTNNLSGGSVKGIIWLPNSTVRGCDGQTVDGTLLVSDTRKNTQTTLRVSSSGKVSLE